MLIKNMYLKFSISFTLAAFVACSSFAGGTTSVGPDLKGKICLDAGGSTLSVENLNSTSVEAYGLCKIGASIIELSTLAKAKSISNRAVASLLAQPIPIQHTLNEFSSAVQLCEGLGAQVRSLYEASLHRFYSTCFFSDGTEMGLQTLYLGHDHPANSLLVKALTR